MDWHSIISTLQARGLSLTQIAFACGCGQATLSDLKNKPEREPSFRLGAKLLSLSKAGDREIQRVKVRADLAQREAA